MYFYSKEEIEQRLSKWYGCGVTFTTHQNGKMFITTNDDGKRIAVNPQDVVPRIVGREAWGIPNFDGLLIFDSKQEMNNYKRMNFA